ncbi:unnamed protein product [Mytilus coruscus]|uniref:Uncharacterized protein n=1 Tax=Mytilus coruscus TaxID=42192 RepID=A0A6J8DGK2_MYTCO|nr:unnamed protein product [Mytilus coruscus]
MRVSSGIRVPPKSQSYERPAKRQRLDINIQENTMTEVISAAVTAKVMENLKDNNILPQSRKTDTNPIDTVIRVHYEAGIETYFRSLRNEAIMVAAGQNDDQKEKLLRYSRKQRRAVKSAVTSRLSDRKYTKLDTNTKTSENFDNFSNSTNTNFNQGYHHAGTSNSANTYFNQGNQFTDKSANIHGTRNLNQFNNFNYSSQFSEVDHNVHEPLTTDDHSENDVTTLYQLLCIMPSTLYLKKLLLQIVNSILRHQ